MKKFAIPCLLVLLVAAFLTAACGDDDDGASDGTDFPLTAPSDAVVTASGLRYLDLTVGDGALPTTDASTLVTVNYRGLFPDGRQFDSSYDRGQPSQFQLGRVIPGFSEGIASMHVGGHRVLYIPGALGYGPAGNSDAGIGPNQDLVFEVELIATE